MAGKATTAWRAGVLVMLAAAAPAALYWYEDYRQVDADAMLNASVSVKTISHVEVDAVGDSVWSASSGSGFLISSRDCEVLTNHHVVANAAHIEIYPRGWSQTSGIPATVLNASPRTDIAILRMRYCGGIREAALGDSDALEPGEQVFAVGNPLGVNPHSISQGIVSHTQRFTSKLIPYLQTDASISVGSSGGPLFDRWGRVIGVNTAVAASPTGNVLGIGYSLPINLVKSEILKLRAGPPSWGYAGIESHVAGLTKREASFFNVPHGQAAVIMTESPEQGPSAGKVFAKDVIYQIDGAPVLDERQAEWLISSHAPGDEVSLKVVRSGELLEIDLTLEEGWQRRDSPGADYYPGHLGLTLEMWNDDEHENNFESPVITHVSSLSPAHMAHITSSQKTLIRNGPVIFPVQLEVKTVTGLVLGGQYHAVESVAALEQLVADAFTQDFPILLEIQTWGRSNPKSFSLPIELLKTSFHMVQPALTRADAPDENEDEIPGETLETSGGLVSAR